MCVWVCVYLPSCLFFDTIKLPLRNIQSNYIVAIIFTNSYYITIFKSEYNYFSNMISLLCTHGKWPKISTFRQCAIIQGCPAQGSQTFFTEYIIYVNIIVIYILRSHRSPFILLVSTIFINF